MAGDGGGLLGRLRIEGPTMPEAMARIADLITTDPEGAAGAGIADLAERAGTSTATVTRFSRMLGFHGYAKFRVAIATETGRAEQARWQTDISADIAPEDPIDQVLGVVATADTRAIQATAAGMDTAGIERVAEAIAGASRVELFGMGSSGTAGREMAFRLERIRIPVWFRPDSHSALTNAALLRSGDVAIGLSHSGRTREVVETLSEAADVVLTTSVHETTFRLAALSALHSQLLVLDLIYVTVAQRTYERTAEALEVTVRAVAAHRLPEPGASRTRNKQARP